MASGSHSAKIQHYVPQCVLRNFNGSNSRLFVFDKLTENVFATSPRGVAAEGGFYDFRDDAGESRSAEGLLAFSDARTAEIIAKILDRQSLGALSRDERRDFSLCAAIQYLRVKAMRQRMKSWIDGVRRVLHERGIDPGNVVPELDYEEVKHLTIAKLGRAPKDAAHFRDKAWILHRAPESNPFYISDNPITLHNLVNPNGLNLDSPGVEIYFPISSTFCICFLCGATHQLMQDGLKQATAIEQSLGKCPIDSKPIEQLLTAIADGSPDILPADTVDHLNSLQVQYSSRFVISVTNDFDLAKRMLRHNPRLKDPPAFVVE